MNSDSFLAGLAGPFGQLAETGGPVLVLLALVSIGATALIILKTLQYFGAKVGGRGDLRKSLIALKEGNADAARHTFQKSRHFLSSVFDLAFDLGPSASDQARLEAEAEQRFVPLERGLRALETVAQLAPLLGLLGTVLGMIEAFQALQSAGSQVDPSALAGGIWVALLTTAAGLTVAMPTSIALSWFESRIENERLYAEYVLSIIASSQGLGASSRA